MIASSTGQLDKKPRTELFGTLIWCATQQSGTGPRTCSENIGVPLSKPRGVCVLLRCLCSHLCVDSFSMLKKTIPHKSLQAAREQSALQIAGLQVWTLTEQCWMNTLCKGSLIRGGSLMFRHFSFWIIGVQQRPLCPAASRRSQTPYQHSCRGKSSYKPTKPHNNFHTSASAIGVWVSSVLTALQRGPALTSHHQSLMRMFDSCIIQDYSF